MQVKDKGNVDKDRLKELGASGVLEVGNNVQAIFGTRSETIKHQIHELISREDMELDRAGPKEDKEPGKRPEGQPE